METLGVATAVSTVLDEDALDAGKLGAGEPGADELGVDELGAIGACGPTGVLTELSEAMADAPAAAALVATAAADGAGCAGRLGAGGGAGIGGRCIAGACEVGPLAAAGAVLVVAFDTMVPGGLLLPDVCPIGGRNGREGEVLPPSPSGGVSGALSGWPICGFGAGIGTCPASGSLLAFAASTVASAAGRGSAFGGAETGGGTGAGGSMVLELELEMGLEIAVSKIGVAVFAGVISGVVTSS